MTSLRCHRRGVKVNFECALTRTRMSHTAHQHRASSSHSQYALSIRHIGNILALLKICRFSRSTVCADTLLIAVCGESTLRWPPYCDVIHVLTCLHVAVIFLRDYSRLCLAILTRLLHHGWVGYYYGQR